MVTLGADLELLMGRAFATENLLEDMAFDRAFEVSGAVFWLLNIFKEGILLRVTSWTGDLNRLENLVVLALG